ncbi:glycoside hydrolase family 25 protein [Ruegeria faecimaris]|uniref:glycoside hydrolase family 25 protein n=1 Tax=Ruegeria faecimaris TaxID=686389 RepID=UPI0024912E95|nr:GH25 family lysozyme [Ruegeria faecimaris]
MECRLGKIVRSFRKPSGQILKAAPDKAQAKGIDVSDHQRDINWPQVAASGVSFALIKATESVSIKDTYFQPNVLGANEVGILCGAYHLLHVSHPAKPQVTNFVDAVQAVHSKGPVGKSGLLHLPFTLDLEGVPTAQGAAYRSLALEWLTSVQRAFGTVPMVYANLNTWETELTSGFGNYPVWLAEYAARPAPNAPQWEFWQHSTNERVSGIAPEVDLDVYCGSVQQLKAQYGVQSRNL